jgi:hypothetical protein
MSTEAERANSEAPTAAANGGTTMPSRSGAPPEHRLYATINLRKKTSAAIPMNAQPVTVAKVVMHAEPNAKVSDGSQPPMTFDLSLSESAGSRSLHRLVRKSFLLFGRPNVYEFQFHTYGVGRDIRWCFTILTGIIPSLNGKAGLLPGSKQLHAIKTFRDHVNQLVAAVVETQRCTYRIDNVGTIVPDYPNKLLRGVRLNRYFS